MEYQIIQSPTDPRIKEYQLLKTKESSDHTFIADHEKTAVRLLESNFSVQSVFCTPKYWEKHQHLIKKRIPLYNNRYVAEKSVFEESIGFSVHQGFMAIGIQKWTLLKDLKFPAVFLNSIVDSENIGSILRTSAAFGIQSLIFDRESASPYLRRCVRVSMGSIFQISLAKIENVLPTLLSFKQENKKIFALSLPQKESTYLKKMRTIGEIQKEGNFILIVGNEAEGIQKNLLDISDHLIYIPMKNQIDSLNVSHALAVALSHILPT